MRRVLLSLCCLAGTASANTIATDSASASASASYAAEPTAKRVEGRIGMLIGGSDVGDADGFSVGLSAGLGYRLGDVTVRAVFDHYRTGDSDGEIANVRRGRGTRVGGALRYSFANTGTDGGLGVDFWGEAGLGLEHVAWREGGVLDRPSGELAVGFELDRAGDKLRRGHRSHIGYFMDFRSFVAQGPEMAGPATCGGPCSRATKPSRTDVSMFFELGLHWGH